jgi:hypothetical protein
MADLRVENPKTTDQFNALLAARNVQLPLRLSEEDLGVVLDADGRDVFTVDSNGERPDAEVEMIAEWIVVAVNTCGGFKAVHHG